MPQDVTLRECVEEDSYITTSDYSLLSIHLANLWPFFLEYGLDVATLKVPKVN